VELFWREAAQGERSDVEAFVGDAAGNRGEGDLFFAMGDGFPAAGSIGDGGADDVDVCGEGVGAGGDVFGQEGAVVGDEGVEWYRR
jgi:hypothetical protein